MKSAPPRTLLRYWGSHFKSARQVDIWKNMLLPVLRRGWRCLLVLERPPENPAWAEELRQEGIELLYVPRPRGHFDFGCARAVFSLCRTHQVDVIHCENIYVSPLIGACLAGVSVRLWTKNNMNDYFEQCRPATLREKIAISTRVAAALATRTIAVCDFVRRELLGMGISDRRIVVQNNFRPASSGFTADRAAARAALGFVESDVVIITVGHAVPVKGWDVLLKAFRELASSNPRARLLMIGSVDAPHEQPCFERLMEYARQEQIEAKIQFVGRVPDVTRYLAAADVFVLPSRSEAFSFALVEAQEMRLPCISTPVGIAGELIADGVNGFLVARNEVEPLAEKLRVLVQDPELRRRFAERTRVFETCPSVPEFGERLCYLYESLLPDNRCAAASVAQNPV